MAPLGATTLVGAMVAGFVGRVVVPEPPAVGEPVAFGRQAALSTAVFVIGIGVQYRRRSERGFGDDGLFA